MKSNVFAKTFLVLESFESFESFKKTSFPNHQSPKLSNTTPPRQVVPNPN